MRWLLAIGFCSFAVACGGDEPRAGRGVADERRGAAAPSGTPARDPMAPPAGRLSDSRRWLGAERSPVSSAPSASAAAPEAEERDLAAELRAAVGDVRGCLAGVDPGTATTLRVSVSAAVSAQGVVTRAYASGSLPREALACVEGRAASARLRAPVPGAPRSVSTTIELRFTPAAPRTVETPPPPPPASAGQVTAIQGAGNVTGPTGSAGTAIGGPSGTAIGGPSGTAIGGPSGTPIGGSY